jgi:hypothetical protein
MRRFLLDTGIAGGVIDRRRGVFERVRHEVTTGTRVGIGMVRSQRSGGCRWTLMRAATQNKEHRQTPHLSSGMAPRFLIFSCSRTFVLS